MKTNGVSLFLQKRACISLTLLLLSALNSFLFQLNKLKRKLWKLKDTSRINQASSCLDLGKSFLCLSKFWIEVFGVGLFVFLLIFWSFGWDFKVF